GQLHTVKTMFRARHNDDVRRLGENAFQPLDVPMNLAVVQDVLIHLGESRVAVADAPKQNDKLQEVGIRLLPERFLRAAEQVVQHCRNRVGDCVGIEIVVQRVVADASVKSDLHVVGGTSSPGQDRADLATEIALHLQHETAKLPTRIVPTPAKQLLDVRI